MSPLEFALVLFPVSVAIAFVVGLAVTGCLYLEALSDYRWEVDRNKWRRAAYHGESFEDPSVPRWPWEKVAVAFGIGVLIAAVVSTIAWGVTTVARNGCASQWRQSQWSITGGCVVTLQDGSKLPADRIKGTQDLNVRINEEWGP